MHRVGALGGKACRFLRGLGGLSGRAFPLLRGLGGEALTSQSEGRTQKSKDAQQHPFATLGVVFASLGFVPKRNSCYLAPSASLAVRLLFLGALGGKAFSLSACACVYLRRNSKSEGRTGFV